MMDFGQLTLELVVGFFSLLVMARFLGKTQITQLTPFDFISALIMGELLGNAIYDDDTHLDKVLYAITIWTVLMITIQILGKKSISLRMLFEGEPTLVIEHGVIDRQALSKNRTNINELLTLLREKDVFSVREVEYALLEPNGSLTVLRKSEFDTPTLQDLKIPVTKRSLPTLLVSDGKILTKELLKVDKSEAWLKSELLKQGFSDPKKVFYAEWTKEDGLYVLAKEPSP